MTGGSVERYLGVPGCSSEGPDSPRSSSGCGARWHHEQRPPAPVMGHSRTTRPCPTALAGPVKGSSSSPVRCSGCRPQQRACSSPITPLARSRAAAQQQAPIRNRPIAVTSDQSRPSILSGPYQAPFHLFFFQSFHLSIPATPPPPHRITFLSELPCSICWKPAACTPSRLQPIESESFS